MPCPYSRQHPCGSERVVARLLFKSTVRLAVTVWSHPMEIEKTIVLTPAEPDPPLKRHSRAKMAIALGVAAVSDALSIWITFAPPLQWTLDLATAVVLFVIFGKRWALL